MSGAMPASGDGMQELQLVLPKLQYEHSYRGYIVELADEERYPFPMDFDCADFAKLLARIDEFHRGANLPAGYVPSTTYWLVQGDELVGVSNLRHHLNDRIRRAGGHVGLGIRPSQRGKGLGKLLLKLTLAEASKHAISTAHVHCYRHNVPSARMIVANGGRLDSELDDDGRVIQRYLIDVA